MSNGPAILLIEDSDTQALLFAETLKDAGMEVHRVASAEAGLEYLRTNRPDLAIVDYHLPGMKGNELCRILRDNSATDSIPLLILTDDTQSRAEQHVLESGADDYVAKSRDPEILLARIKLLLRRSKARNVSSIDDSAFYKAQRVLLVDDSATYLAFLESELGHDGYSIFTAESGEAALEIAEREPVDCAVVDLIMPGMDGIELCRRLLRRRGPGRSMPVLIVTARGSKEKMLESLEVGADDFVEKSSDATVLRARLRALLRRKILQDEYQRIHDEIHDKEMELVRERAHKEAYLRAILDNAADGIIVTDDKGSIRTFNSAAQKIFGYAVEEIIGRNVALLVSEPMAVPRGQRSETGARNGERSAMVGLGPREAPARRRDGSPFPAELTAGEIATDDERLFVYIVRDVTERHRVENALIAAEERTHLLLDSVVEGIYGVDLEGRITFVNRSALKMLELSEEELLGRDAYEALRHRQAEGAPGRAEDSPALRAARTEETSAGVAETFRKKDGSGLSVELSSQPVYKDGELVGAVVSFEDVTYRRDLEARLHQAQKMEAIGRLTGGVAHDFNNLLTVIMGNLRLLARSLGDNEPALDRIERVLRAARSGAELTRRMLSFSRQQVLEITTIKLNELVETMEDMLRRTMGENIAISTALADGPCLGRSDENQLENALLNLCVNARDAMPDGGRLTIETRHTLVSERYAGARDELQPGRYIEIAVTDTGTGIPPEIVDKIFEPFYTTKDMGEGTGLGLSTIFGFMKQSGGHISVYSEIGEGTTFRLLIPEAEAEAGREPGGEQGPARADGPDCAGEATILVVEDEQEVREIAVSMLSEAGYRIIEADSGPSGLAAIAEHPEIDLVFSDVIMPGGMTGPQMVEQIRRRRPEMPVVFACGYAQQALKDRNAQIHIPRSRFLPKPYEASELTSSIHALLEGAAAGAAPRRASG